jgi:hypothetical protein
MFWPLHWYCVDKTALPHAVLAALIACRPTSQQIPLVQQPGLALGIHSPNIRSQLLMAQGLPDGAQSASLVQQASCSVPAHLPAAPHTSLNVQAFPSLQAIPMPAVQLLMLAKESQIWQPLAGFCAPCDWHAPSIKHQPALVAALHSPLLGSQVELWQGLGSTHSTSL